jgi:hypothetical protein
MLEALVLTRWNLSPRVLLCLHEFHQLIPFPGILPNDGISGLLLFRPESAKWTLARVEGIRLTNNDIKRLARRALL